MNWTDLSILQPGAVIAERFVVEREVARGGMGVVYRALDRLRDESIALKILSQGMHRPEYAERFEQEAALLMRLVHPRIVAHVAHGKTESGHLYLAMQWLEGQDLGERISKGPLLLRDCRRLLEKICDALAYVHTQGVIHRDIKPSNIFLRAGNIDDPVLVDFGIARGINRSFGLTQTGTVLGTPNYMSPEQARGSSEIQPAADIFSLACVLYECLTGTSPFASDHVAAVLAKILFDHPKPAVQMRPLLPKAYDDLLARMLSKEPKARPQNANALLEEIRALPSLGLDSAETMTSIIPPPNSGVMDAEQSLVSIVLCLPGDPGQKDLGSDHSPSAQFDSIKIQLNRFGADIEQMADGSMLATIIAKSSAVDQARIAARCALFLRDLRHNDRISIATGRGQWQGTMPVGEAVERAARLLRSFEEQKPSESGIWLDEVTAGLLGARFETKALQKGLFELLKERSSADTERLLLGRPTPCVGREPELAQLEAIWMRCMDDGVPNAIVLTAPAGLGKSRIRIEFLRRVQEKYPEARALLGFGDPLSAGSPYGLLGQALRHYAHIRTGSPLPEQRAKLLDKLCASISDAEKTRVAEFLGELCGISFSSEQSPMLLAARRDPKAMSEQIQHAFLDFICAECAKYPMIIALEDLQWGDALTIQLLDTLLRQRNDIPLLILAFSRPELLEVHPALWQGRVQEMPLRPLSKKVCERYVEEMLGEKKLGSDTLSRIVNRSAGNPLFLEELIRAASEGRTEQIPETVLAMLQARLSRLAPEARKMLRNASIFGENFWAGGLQGIFGDGMSASSIGQWLDQLLQSEWIERRRQSHLENEREYAFRHAIARDAAYSLLTESERVHGHKQAFVFLEGAGERDPMTLAGHAELGNEREKAIEYYTKAAEESLKRNDLAEAGRRAALGAGLGASGEHKGVLRALQAISAFGLADWRNADTLGSEALQLLPHGHRYWFQVAEKLMHFLPTIGQFDRFQKLIDEIDSAKPMPDAQSAQICVVAAIAGVFGLVGIRERAEHYADRIEKIRGPLLETDAYVNGVVHLYLGWLSFFMQSSPYLSFIHGQQSERMFEETRVLHSLSFARSVTGAARGALGDYSGAEQAFRSALEIAKQVQDHYMIAHIKAYLANMIVHSWPLGALDEAQDMALSLLDNALSHTYGGFAQTTLANVHLRRGQLNEAESKARLACQMMVVAPPCYPLASAVLVDVLAEQQRWDEALAAASEGLDLIKRAGGLGAFEIPFRVAAADAYLQAGKHEEGIALLKHTLQEIDRRSNKIEDQFLKNCYLHQNIDNLRAFGLQKKWLSSDY